ncbi:MAG: hypothetical protein NTZ65_03875 [Candidatus Berkelbacteria bacterium]|nr:hypothetical protein [Candidatus Berkelbacteria bacterium]
MKNFMGLEEKVKNHSALSKKKYATVAAIAIVLGLGLVAGGVLLNSSQTQIFASTDTPPTPAIPTRSAPPTPPIPSRTGNFSFAAGWSMISGDALYGYDLTNFLKAGLTLYSFNDPKVANRDWTVKGLVADTSCAAGQSCPPTPSSPTNTSVIFYPQPPFGYYVYNPGTAEAKVDLKPGSAPDLSNQMVARGWHTLYWPGEATTKDELLKNITLKYADGTILTAAQAVASDQHKASIEIYVVTDEHSIDVTASSKLLTSTDSSAEISKIPKNSYFWLYLRRTQYRVTDVYLASQSISTAEKEAIDVWLKANNYTDCGDAAGTIYTGSSCLFDEATNTTRDKYEYLVNKFPDKPWFAASTPPTPATPSATSTS